MKKIIVFIYFAISFNLFAEFSTKAKSALLTDYDSSSVLYSKNPDVLMPPSSVLKLMTLTIVFDKIKSGELNMDSLLYVSKNADYRNKLFRDASKICLQEGQKITVKDAILGLIVLSAGDAGIVVAENIAGTEQKYLDLMTKKARSINMPFSSFGNVSGLPHYDNLMTSREMNILADYIITEYPDIYPLFSTRIFKFQDYKNTWCEVWGQNHTINYNKLLFIMGGADGLKTGHTAKGGFAMVASAKIGGRRLIGVLNGLNVKDHNELAREMKKLLQYGFSSFKNKVFYQKNQTILKVPVWYGVKSKVEATVKKNFTMTLPKNADLSNIRVLARYNKVKAPIYIGQEIGTILIEHNGNVIQENKLIAKENIKKAKFLRKIYLNIAYIIHKVL